MSDPDEYNPDGENVISTPVRPARRGDSKKAGIKNGTKPKVDDNDPDEYNPDEIGQKITDGNQNGEGSKKTREKKSTKPNDYDPDEYNPDEPGQKIVATPDPDDEEYPSNTGTKGSRKGSLPDNQNTAKPNDDDTEDYTPIPL